MVLLGRVGMYRKCSVLWSQTGPADKMLDSRGNNPRTIMKNIWSAVLLVLSLWMLNADATTASPELTPEIASKYAIYSMMSANAYHKKGRVKFRVEDLGWTHVDAYGEPTSKPSVSKKSGLAYDIFEKKDSNEVIFAFRGSDSQKDYLTASFVPWPFTVQYTQASRALDNYLRHNPDKKVSVTGHSLGGALALSMSVRYGLDAVVFDASPRVLDGFNEHYLPANRILIYQNGEILALFRTVWRKIFKVVPRENIYMATFDFGKINKHRSDYLALELLKLGATVDGSLVAVLPKGG